MSIIKIEEKLIVEIRNIIIDSLEEKNLRRMMQFANIFTKCKNKI